MVESSAVRLPSRGTFLLFGCLVLAGAALLMVGTSASASHYRYGSLNWNPVAGASAAPTGLGLVEFGGEMAWRTNSLGVATVGQAVLVGPLDFGDLTTPAQMYMCVTEVNAFEDYYRGALTDANCLPILHLYTTPGPFTASWSSCCRVGLSAPLYAHINNPGLSQRLETNVQLTPNPSAVQLNGGPVTSMPVFQDCTPGLVCTFPVPAVDPNADAMTWRLATPAEACCAGFVQPGPPWSTFAATIAPATGVYTWNTAGVTMGGQCEALYSTQVMVQDASTKTPVDFFIRLTQALPPPAPSPLTNGPGPVPLLSTTLNWPAVTIPPPCKVTQYNIYRSLVSGTYPPTPYASVPGTVLTYTDMPLSPCTTYYYVVTAVDAAGESPYSNEVSWNTDPTGQCPPAPCPAPSVGLTPPACVTPCPPPTVGVMPACVTPPCVKVPCICAKVPITPCPPTVPPTCPLPTVGVPPKCYGPCPPGQVGHEPLCVPNPCPSGASDCACDAFDQLKTVLGTSVPVGDPCDCLDPSGGPIWILAALPIGVDPGCVPDPCNGSPLVNCLCDEVDGLAKYVKGGVPGPDVCACLAPGGGPAWLLASLPIGVDPGCVPDPCNGAPPVPCVCDRVLPYVGATLPVNPCSCLDPPEQVLGAPTAIIILGDCVPDPCHGQALADCACDALRPASILVGAGVQNPCSCLDGGPVNQASAVAAPAFILNPCVPDPCDLTELPPCGPAPDPCALNPAWLESKVAVCDCIGTGPVNAAMAPASSQVTGGDCVPDPCDLTELPPCGPAPDPCTLNPEWLESKVAVCDCIGTGPVNAAMAPASSQVTGGDCVPDPCDLTELPPCGPAPDPCTLNPEWLESKVAVCDCIGTGPVNAAMAPASSQVTGGDCVPDVCEEFNGPPCGEVPDPCELQPAWLQSELRVCDPGCLTCPFTSATVRVPSPQEVVLAALRASLPGFAAAA